MAEQETSMMGPSSPVAGQRSPWHSPVPYLFGGLAAMLGLIAFALLILACSYWKLSGYVENPADGDRDLESGDGDGDSKPENSINNKTSPAFEEKYLVIMAGQERPTYLATPISSKASSFGGCSCRSISATASEVEVMEKGKLQGCNDQVQLDNIGNHETADQGS